MAYIWQGLQLALSTQTAHLTKIIHRPPKRPAFVADDNSVVITFQFTKKYTLNSLSIQLLQIYDFTP